MKKSEIKDLIQQNSCLFEHKLEDKEAELLASLFVRHAESLLLRVQRVVDKDSLTDFTIDELIKELKNDT